MFEESEYAGQVFDKLALVGAILRERDFTRCTFSKCDFSGCDLESSAFSQCLFDRCNLSVVKVNDVSFNDVTFKDSKLIGIDFTRCTINFVALGFKNCLIETCNFSALMMPRTRFENDEIRASIFSETNLTKAVFSDCDLERSIFHKTKLEGTDFSTAKNFTIDPTTNGLKGAKFSLPEAVSLLRSLQIVLE